MALSTRNRGHRRRPGPAIAVVSAVTMMLAACGGGPAEPAGQVAEGWDAIVAAASTEGTLTIGSAPGAGYEAFAEYAKEQLPDLDIEFTFISPSDYVGRAISEQDSGAFLWDLFSGGITNVYGSLHPDYLEPIMPVLDDIPDDVKRDEDWAGGGFEVFTDPADPRTFINEWSIAGGIYINRDLAPDLDDPSDLLDPKYRGMIGLYDPRSENQTSQALAWFMETQGEDYVRSIFRDQEPQISGDAETLAQWIAEGRIAVGLGVQPEALRDLQAEGIGTSVERSLEMGTILSGRGISVLRNAPHPNAVRVFLHWFLSRDGQDAWARLAGALQNTRRVDADPASYGREALPDFDNFDQYPIRPGTVESGDQVARAVAIVKEFLT